MDAKAIAAKAEEWRHEVPGMSNYKTMLNDAWVMMRELAKQVVELQDQVAQLQQATREGK